VPQIDIAKDWKTPWLRVLQGKSNDIEVVKTIEDICSFIITKLKQDANNYVSPNVKINKAVLTVPLDFD